MKTIQNYLDLAIQNFNDHAWDDWDFSFSAEIVAKDAARNQEISWKNVPFLKKQIIASYNKSQKKPEKPNTKLKEAATKLKKEIDFLKINDRVNNLVNSCPVDDPTAVEDEVKKEALKQFIVFILNNQIANAQTCWEMGVTNASCQITINNLYSQWFQQFTGTKYISKNVIDAGHTITVQRETPEWENHKTEMQKRVEIVNAKKQMVDIAPRFN